jgi:hypothetical protein
LRKGIRERGFLDERACGAAGFEAKRLKLRGCEEGSDMLVARSRAAAVEVVVGEEGHVGADFLIEGG